MIPRNRYFEALAYALVEVSAKMFQNFSTFDSNLRRFSQFLRPRKCLWSKISNFRDNFWCSTIWHLKKFWTPKFSFFSDFYYKTHHCNIACARDKKKCSKWILESPCETENGGCSHDCLDRGDGQAVCSCPCGYFLDIDKVS